MDRYFDRIAARFKKQEKKGISKYGQILEDNHRPLSEAIEFALEEVTDLMMYLEESKEKVAKMERVIEAAKKLFNKNGCPYTDCAKCDPKYIAFCNLSQVGQALAAYEGKDDVSEL